MRSNLLLAKEVVCYDIICRRETGLPSAARALERTMPTVRKVTIEANVGWRAQRSTTSQRWIGVCEELNLSMEADSLDELHSLIPETMHLLMIDLLEDNELDQYLRDRGWRSNQIPAHDRDDIEFEMPWHMVAEGKLGSERRPN